MEKNLTIVIFILLMVATIVAVDILFFRHRFLARLIANIAIVLIFITSYFAFLNRA